ncbi:gluconokinase [Pleurocapsa sp. FMAR1]|uniref:gluconokinase n=1 Tax=Pleurocapsa sp. FMAR1 TaxID=3040204 RepID=UPI0029C64F96|nr:gluconokinase [Pleurocapsa sp. FMAR1]
MSKYVIGVDIGTTSTKSVLYSDRGRLIEKHAVGYPLNAPTLGAAVQNPEQIFQAVVTTVKRIVENSGVNQSEILCLSFSAAMHSLIVVDGEGKPLTPILTWADNRSADWADKLKECGGHEIYTRTGTPIHPMSPLVKLMWLRESKPELWQQAAKFISIKEYIFWQLFREYIVDYSIASATGLFNFNSLTWDTQALDLAGIKASQLSQLVPTTHILRSLKTEYADEMGIAADTPVVVGANDGVLANLGVGAIAPGIATVTVGSSGAVRTTVRKPQTDPQQRLFCYPLTEDYWVIGGAVNNGGITLRWVRDHLADAEIDTAKLLKQDPYDMLTAIAQTIPAGSEGLIFHPYLSGERSPLWDANARGSFFGLALHHNKAHLIRSVLEGVVYNLYLVFQALESITGEVKTIKAAGGFARSPLWRQMLADVFNRQVSIPESYESSSLGAAILGLYAIGEIADLRESQLTNGEIHQHQPIASNVANYQKILPLYCRLLDSFKTEYAAIAQLQKDLQQ